MTTAVVELPDQVVEPLLRRADLGHAGRPGVEAAVELPDQVVHVVGTAVLWGLGMLAQPAALPLQRELLGQHQEPPHVHAAAARPERARVVRVRVLVLHDA